MPLLSVPDTTIKPAKRPKCAKGYHISKNAYTLVYTLQGHKGVGKGALSSVCFNFKGKFDGKETKFMVLIAEVVCTVESQKHYISKCSTVLAKGLGVGARGKVHVYHNSILIFLSLFYQLKSSLKQNSWLSI